MISSNSTTSRHVRRRPSQDRQLITLPVSRKATRQGKAACRHALRRSYIMPWGKASSGCYTRSGIFLPDRKARKGSLRICDSTHRMKRLVFLALLISAQWLGIAECTAAPTTFPTGVTIHNREKAFVGLTMFNFMAENRIFLIDMEGNIVNTWVSPNGGRFGPLAKPMPDGKLMALFGTHNDRGIGIFDWDGNLLWEFYRDGWNLNHDFVYGAPYFGADILPNQNVLILAKIESNYPNIASYTILDDNIVFIDRDKTDVSKGGIFALITPSGLFIKRVQVRVDGGVDIISDNRDYPVQTVPREEVTVCVLPSGCQP